MFSSSPKWLTIDTSRQSPNLVTPTSHQSKQQHFTPKNKNEQNLFKSNLMSRYSSQEDLQSYARPKYSIEDLNNSPKSQQDYMFKKNTFIPRKSNNIPEKTSNNFRPNQVKRKSNLVQTQQPYTYFKNPALESKAIKHLKQTSSTNSTQNLGYAKSQKSIPSFLKATFNNKRKSQQTLFSRVKQSNHFSQDRYCDQIGIDNFQIIFKLGEGKFGCVFLAVEKTTGFMVALKVIEKRKVIEENFLTQFIRQIKIQASLQHPNIAKVYGFFHDAQYFYSILQLGQGGQLYDIVKNGQTLSEQSTSFIIGNLLDAITYIHSKKILHRDIKPQNIVLVHGNVKLCDFGWAVYKKGQLRSTFCGTPLYLSPELLNGEKYDQKVDLWAIGILAFELHLGSSPFNIQSQQDLLKIITNQIQYPQDCYASKHFKQFIGAVLKKDPKQRLQARKLMQLKFIRKYRELQTCQQLCQ